MLQLKDGKVFEGILSEMNFKGDQPGVTIKMVKLLSDPSQESDLPLERPQPQMLIPAEEVAQITAHDVRMSAGDVGDWDDAGGFGTDAAISRGRGG